MALKRFPRTFDKYFKLCELKSIKDVKLNL